MTLGDRIAVMSKGEIQQVAPPLEVYRRPVNRFVAGFVGMPPMNFIDGRIERGDEGLLFTDGADVRLSIPDAIVGSVEDRTSGNVVLGVRPEALRIVTGGADAFPTFAATVRVVEPLGDRQDIFVHTAKGDELVARLETDEQCSVGDSVRLGIRPEAMHFFEPGESGRHLVYGT